MNSIEVVNGTLLRRAGPEDAPLLMFFPAFGDSGLCYSDVFSTDLSASYHLIAVDLWGFGASPARTDVRTLEEFSSELENLVLKFWSGQPIGLIGHSISGPMATNVAHRLGNRVSGVFSIEGNLTPDDAMFTGKANNFDDPISFKNSFLDEIWNLGQQTEAFRHYYAGARMGDPETMWYLGRDAGRASLGNKLGESFRNLSQPSLYYWSKQSTPKMTQQWIKQSGIQNEIYCSAGHWPMVEQPIATAQRIGRFFDDLRS